MLKSLSSFWHLANRKKKLLILVNLNWNNVTDFRHFRLDVFIFLNGVCKLLVWLCMFGGFLCPAPDWRHQNVTRGGLISRTQTLSLQVTHHP